jgi:Fe2+ or Zn2+ uptake regulation protein
MSSYTALIEEDRHLVILRILEEDPGYSQNEAVLQTCLAALGHNVSRDRVVTDLTWLAEQGLVTIDEVVNVKVATLTARGADTAQGRATVPGVKRPSPR